MIYTQYELSGYWYDMKLPKNTIIAPEKLKHYLLKPQKNNDKSKWLASAGYLQNNWQNLIDDLRIDILSKDAIFVKSNEYGDYYRIDGILNAPLKNLQVTTIWMKERHTKFVKFITMYPNKRR
jgi:hypothetical protein